MSLSDLGKKHKTDKWNADHSFKGRSYLDVYEDYFAEYKDREINILEIGVRQGGSLKTWKDYFSKAKIFGLDNNPDCKKHEEERIEIAIGEQQDWGILQYLLDRSGGFDIIIDDGSHINELTLLTAKYMLPSLRSGGIYIIEDLRTSYQDLNKIKGKWEGELLRNEKMKANLNNNRETLNEFFMELIKDMDYCKGDITSVQFWSRICVIKK